MRTHWGTPISADSTPIPAEGTDKDVFSAAIGVESAGIGVSKCIRITLRLHPALLSS